MNTKMEREISVEHISIKVYLENIIDGTFPSRLLESRPFDDFRYEDKRYIVDLEPEDKAFVFPDIEFEKLIKPNIEYVKYLMDHLNKVTDRFVRILNRVQGDHFILKDKNTILQQAYLFKVSRCCKPPLLINQDREKGKFFQDFCQLVALAFMLKVRPQDFAQFLVTSDKNINKMKGMAAYLSLQCIDKKSLFSQFMRKKQYKNASVLTLMRGSALRSQLLTHLTDTYNAAVSLQSTTIRAKIRAMFGTIEILVVTPDLTVEKVLDKTARLLNGLKAKEVFVPFQKSPFYIQSCTAGMTPQKLVAKIENYLKGISDSLYLDSAISHEKPQAFDNWIP